MHLHTTLHPFYSSLDFVRNYPGELVPEPIWILPKQETVSVSGIRWAICKSASRPRQITMPALHHSVFYGPDALPATQPTASKHWRQLTRNAYNFINVYMKRCKCLLRCFTLVWICRVVRRSYVGTTWRMLFVYVNLPTTPIDSNTRASPSSSVSLTVTSPPPTRSRPKHCDESVCLSVCPSLSAPT